MKHFCYGFAVFFGLILGLSAAAQAQTAILRGTVADSTTGETAPGITLTLIDLRDSTKTLGVTDINGTFRLENLKPGPYSLQLSGVGYALNRRNLRLGPGERDLGRLTVSPKIESTKEVTVTGRKPPVQQKGDTVQFNADQFKVNKDASTEELIAKMPGIQVENGTVKAQGEDVKRVLVDGKPFFGEDPNAALKNLPAEVVDKVEVFDERSESSRFSGFNDGNTNKAINIVTKANMRNGAFGNVSAGYGTNDRYKVGGSLNKFNGAKRITVLANFNNINEQNFAIEDLVGAMGGGGGRGGGFGTMMRAGMMGGGSMRGGWRGGGGGSGGGGIGEFLVQPQGGITETQALGLNFSNSWGTKWEASGSYFFNRTNNNANSETFRTFFARNDTTQRYTETNLSNSINQNHRFNLRLEYKPNDRNSILFIPRYSLQLNEGRNDQIGITRIGDTEAGNTRNLQNTNLTGYNINNRLMLRHRFEKAGRTISLELESAINNNFGDNSLRSTQRFGRGDASIADTILQRGDLNKTSQTWGATLEYTEPLSEFWQAQGTYSYSRQQTDSDKKTFNQLLGAAVIDTALSNVFVSTYTTQKVGATLLYNQGPDNLNLSLNVQDARLDNTQDFPQATTFGRGFQNVLPRLVYTRRVGAGRQLRVVYNTSTQAPSIDQLQNVVNNSNPLFLSAGNPDLRQDYRHFVIARYSSTNLERNSNFFAFVNYQYGLDYVANSTIIADRPTTLPNGVFLRPGTQYSTTTNLDGFWSSIAFVSYGLPFTPLKSNVNFNLNTNLSSTPGLINGNRNDARSYTYGGGVTIGSNISEKIDFTIGSRPSWNSVVNTLNSAQNTDFFSNNSSVRLNWQFWKAVVFTTNLSHQYYQGLSQGFNQNFWLWNVAIAKKFLANEQAEIRLSVFDALGQNNSISRNSTETYVEDTRTLVLQRYYMLTFSWRIRSFRSAGGANPGMGGPGGPGGPGSPGGPPPMMRMFMPGN